MTRPGAQTRRGPVSRTGAVGRPLERPLPPDARTLESDQRPGVASVVAANTAADSRLLRAILPLRFFVGGTFLYAGLDKLLNPSFLRESGPGSIGQQLFGFTHSSPLAPLVQALALPHPIVIGGLMALAEIAVGLGLVLGLLYRWSAIGGFLIAVLFFLTASWATQPYYYGPDLPYAAGFLTLALVGRPGPYTILGYLERSLGYEQPDPRTIKRRSRDGRPLPVAPAEFSPDRRAFLQASVLAVLAVAVGGSGYVLGKVLGGGDLGLGDGGSGGLPGGSTSGAGSTPAPGASAASGGGSANSIGTMSQLNQQGAFTFTDPSSGDPAWAIQIDGKVAAYDATCTHQGCPVQYDPSQKLFACPCHGAEFDATHQAAVIAGPARDPLRPIAVHVDGQGNVILG